MRIKQVFEDVDANAALDGFVILIEVGYSRRSKRFLAKFPWYKSFYRNFYVDTRTKVARWEIAVKCAVMVVQQQQHCRCLSNWHNRTKQERDNQSNNKEQSNFVFFAKQ